MIKGSVVTVDADLIYQLVVKGYNVIEYPIEWNGPDKFKARETGALKISYGSMKGRLVTIHIHTKTNIYLK
jgi:hypothetical protein